MKFVPMSVTRAVSRQKLVLVKNSPHISFGIGLALNLTSTYLACRATLKLSETLDDIKYDIDQVKGLKESSSPKDYGRDMAYVYGKATGKMIRLYGPAVGLGALSFTALTHSHVTLTKRNTALAAAFTGLHEAFNAYRGRVRDAVGEEKELDIYHGVTLEKIEDEDGNSKRVKKVTDPNKISPYARFFDEASVHWQKDPELNRLYIQCQQNWFNNLLQARGHVFLNEVYDALGIDRSRAGQVVGWVLGPDGDNYIDFGLYNVDNSRFMNGYERSILLDFNVDGVIFDKI